MLFRSCLFTVICFVSVLFIVDGNIDADIGQSDDILTKNDSLRISNAILQVLKFARKNKNDIDVNFAYGLTIVYDNLKNVLIKKKHKIPEKLKLFIKNLLKYNDEVLQFFNFMVKRDIDEKSTIYRQLFTLFSNRTLGIQGVVSFNATNKIVRVNPTESIFPKWKDYEQKVFRSVGKPNVKDSDRCLSSLARNKLNRPKCKLHRSCYKLLHSGTDYGYALTHRLLWVLQAKRGRGCTLFSVDRDKDITKKLCRRILNEATYIAMNGFKALDLLLEQMALCSLAGYADTLRRSWILETLRYQTPFGCFNLTLHAPPVIPEHQAHPWKIYFPDSRMLGGACERHPTAVAAATLAAAFRLILETYY